jgi:hypothetical protein
MREYEYTIDEAIKNGLSPLDVTPPNTLALYKYFGFRCGRTAELYSPKTDPLPNTLDMYYEWPYPQFIAGDGWNILAVYDPINKELVLYSVADDMETVSLIGGIDELTFGVGTLLEVADFGSYIMMTNGAAIIYRNIAGSSWNLHAGNTTVPLMKTICNFKGQIIGGGILSDWHSCDETFYVWSRIGEANFYPTLRNQEGFRKCPYGGNVQHVRRLNDVVIGYSSKGITQLFPVNEPVVSFGFKELSDSGIVNQGALDGSIQQQIYVDENYRVQKITSEGIKELGYKNYVEQLVGEAIIVQYDPLNKDFYIGNSTKTFLLTPYGMSEIPQHPSAVWKLNGSIYALPETLDDDYYEIVSEAINFGYGGQKTIFTIETDFSPIEDGEVSVDYLDKKGSFISHTYSPVNYEGIGNAIVSSSAFRAKLRFNPIHSTINGSYIKLRYKMTDLRGIRGVYAPPPRGQF